jgi:hypothetical protein
LPRDERLALQGIYAEEQTSVALSLERGVSPHVLRGLIRRGEARICERMGLEPWMLA